MRDAVRRVAVDEGLVNLAQAGQQALVQLVGVFAILLHLGLGQAVGLAHADDLVRGQRAAAHAAFVAATVHLRFQADARLATHVQRANALGAVDLVRSQAHQVDRHGLHVDRRLAGGLGRVHMEHDALLAAQCADGLDVLDHADLVVHEHHADQDGVGADGRLQHVQVNQAVFLHVQISHFKALALQLAHGVQYRLVLGLDRDQVLAAALVELGRALDRQVVGFGSAAGPDDFTRIGVDQRSDLLAGVVHRVFGFPAPGVAARRRVAVVLGQPRDHGLGHTGINRGGRGVVQIDRVLLAHDGSRSVGWFTWKSGWCPKRTPSWVR